MLKVIFKLKYATRDGRCVFNSQEETIFANIIFTVLCE